MKRKLQLAVLVGLIVLLLSAIGVMAQGPTGGKQPSPRAPSALAGTAFTYQGQLKNGGTAVNNTCDFEFSLWDGPNLGANQIGGNQPRTNVTVSNGLFTIGDLDFGNGAFTGDARWLLIGVRCPAGSGGFSMLAPRQALTPAPMAFALPGLYTQQNVTSTNIIGGHVSNTVTSGVYGAVIGGGGRSSYANNVTDNYGVVGGGSSNWAGNNLGSTSDASYATVGGGTYNYARGSTSTIGGGVLNEASNDSATIGGGESNTANGIDATVGGGSNNTASGTGTFVGGGGNNGSTIKGNKAQAPASTIAGGFGNVISPTATYAFIGGGYSNTATGIHSTVGGGINNTANGNTATVGGGWGNTASDATTTVSGGYGNSASGSYATISGGIYNFTSGTVATVPGGSGAQASHYGQMAYASGSFAFGTSGDAQTSVYVSRNTTTNATVTELFLDGTSQRITLASNQTLAFDILVTGRTSTGQTAGYQLLGVIKNVGGTTTLVGTITKRVLGEDDTNWDATAEADDTNDALAIKVTGVAATTIRWVATTRTVEVGY